MSIKINPDHIRRILSKSSFMNAKAISGELCACWPELYPPELRTRIQTAVDQLLINRPKMVAPNLRNDWREGLSNRRIFWLDTGNCLKPNRGFKITKPIRSLADKIINTEHEKFDSNNIDTHERHNKNIQDAITQTKSSNPKTVAKAMIKADRHFYAGFDIEGLVENICLTLHRCQGDKKSITKSSVNMKKMPTTKIRNYK